MAGSSMKDIKLRIKSVESTMQTTKAMQLVASSKLRKAKEHMENSRQFAAVSHAAVQAAASCCNDGTIPYATEREVRKRCCIVIAGDRGLAGGYNNNIFKAVDSNQEVETCYLPIGKKATERYMRQGKEIVSQEYDRVESLSVGKCFKAARKITEDFRNGAYDEVVIYYTDFVSMLSQEVRTEKLLPIEKPAKENRTPVSTVYDPTPEEVLENIIPDYLAGRLYSAACDSYASEVAARRTAMDSATKNAGEMIGDLKLRYNRARQGAITQEITEIVAGAEQ